MALTRIHLIMRDVGLGSRRRAEELIREGRVTLNGRIVRDPGEKADPYKDHIKVNGKLLQPPDPLKRYYVFNKPRNVVSTFDDPQGRPCIGDLLRQLKQRLFAVGRLDFDAEGIMILTNDGDLAQAVSHPSHAVPRTYLVKVKGEPDSEALSRIRKGMAIGEGDRVGEINCAVLSKQKTTTWLKVVLFEGKKNEIKRIFTRINHPVRKLRRIRFGPLTLGKLPVGEWRPLTNAEIAKIKSLAHPNDRRS
ncbi:MAG: rRNA pseudouridine synthase [Deltaproteobacteria bacterium]|nr:rRNA pseudouridine synthase [Deltaproteobacteria bacterium]